MNRKLWNSVSIQHIVTNKKLESLNSQVYFDNYFYSPMLHPILTKKKYCVVTVQTSRPNLLKQLISTEKNLRRGEALSLQNDHVFFTKWFDNNLFVNPKH